LLIVIISHHYTEAHSVEALQERHRSEEADARLEGTPADAVDDPAGEPEEREPPAEPRTPADD